MRDEFGAQDPRSTMLRFHTQTAGVQLTAQQPEVNLVRVTVQALAAVLGGTQSLHTNSYDEAIALPTEKAARLALRTQQVIAYETDLTATVDPFAGSYAVEAMTDEIEAEIRELMDARRGARRRGGGHRGRATRSARSSSRRTTWCGRSRTAPASSSASTGSGARPTRSTSRSGSTRPSRPQQADRLARLRAERDNAEVRPAPGGAASGGRRAPTTCSTRCTTRCGPGPRSARSATRCATSGASTTPPTPSDRRDA